MIIIDILHKIKKILNVVVMLLNPSKVRLAMLYMITSPHRQIAVFKQYGSLWPYNLAETVMHTGGQLVVACFCVDSDGNYLGKSPHVKCSMYDVMTECWQEMVTEGKITRVNIHSYQYVADIGIGSTTTHPS